jgi:hypothetical protein
VLLVAAALGVWLVTRDGASGDDGWERAGQRVDAQDRDDACFETDPPRCVGSGPPLGVVAADRRRVLVVWEGGYRPGAYAVFARELDADGRPLGEPRELGPREHEQRPLAARATDTGYEIAWDGVVRSYSADLEPSGERRGRLPARRDPNVTTGRYGRPVAHVPDGADVALYRTMDWQIRAIPLER